MDGKRESRFCRSGIYLRPVCSEYREKQQGDQGCSDEQRLHCSSDFFTNQMKCKDKGKQQNREDRIIPEINT